jgi:small-conductance mechanosensitive channel
MPVPALPATPPASPHPLNSTPFDRNFWEGDASWMVLADVAKIVLLYLLLRFVLRRLVDRVLWPALKQGEKKIDPAQASRIKTLASLVNSSISYILTFVFGIMLLRALRLDPIPLLTTASVAGLAVGFGAQKLVKDMISGFFILLEDQYAVGDYVTVGAVTGTVEEVGLRTTRIRDDAGKLYILSNGDITQVCNQSRGAVASFVEIGIAPAADVGKATDIINKAGEELAHAQSGLGFAEPPSVQGLGAMDAAKLTLRVSCPVTAPAKLTQAQIALRGLAHQRLVEAEIGLA